jgi:hypothetical protein
MKITLEWLEKQDACIEGVNWFKTQEEIDGLKVVKALIADNQLDWANWTIVRIMKRKQYVTYAVFAAEQVAYLWKDKYPKEYAIWKKWVDSGCKRGAAWAAARDASWAAGAAARDASGAAARDAAGSAAGAAAGDAAGAAAWAAARDAWAAGAAARDASWAAWSAARDAWAAGDAWDAAKKEMQLKILTYGIGLLEEK